MINFDTGYNFIIVVSTSTIGECYSSDSKCWTLPNQLVLYDFTGKSFQLFFHLINYSNRKIRVVEEVLDTMINW